MKKQSYVILIAIVITVTLVARSIFQKKIAEERNKQNIQVASEIESKSLDDYIELYNECIEYIDENSISGKTTNKIYDMTKNISKEIDVLEDDSSVKENLSYAFEYLYKAMNDYKLYIRMQSYKMDNYLEALDSYNDNLKKSKAYFSKITP